MKTNPGDPYGPGQCWHLVNEDQLQQLIVTLAPDIQRNTDRMADLIRELVKLEREKAGLDKPVGTIELWSNKEKKTDTQPDMIGSGRIAGRVYRAAAWISNPDKLKVSLQLKERK